MLKWLKALMQRRTSSHTRTGGAMVYPSRSKAGPHINQYEAMTLSAYYACIRVFSSAFVQMPWQVFRIEGDDSREHARDHSVDRVLNRQANPEMTAATFREMMAHWVLSWGNAYAEVVRDASGRVTELWPLEPWRVTPLRYWPETGNDRLVYQVTNYNNNPVFFDPGDILHFRGLGDDLEGWSVVRLAANALGLSSAQEASMSGQMREGVKMSGVMSPPANSTMTAENLKAAKESFVEQMAGSNSHGKVWFANKGMTFQPLNIPNTDMQMLESRKFSVIEVCRFAGVPPHKCFDFDRATWNNVEQANTDFLVDTIGPWVCKFENEANSKLITRPRLYETRFDTSELTRADFATRVEGASKLWGIGALNTDEVRRRFDLNPLPGDQGNAYWVPVNMQPVEQALNPPEPEPMPAISSDPAGLIEGQNDGE